VGLKAQWFRGGLVFKAHRLVYHSTLGLRVVKKNLRDGGHFEVILIELPVGKALVHRDVQRFRGGIVFKAHRLCASLT